MNRWALTAFAVLGSAGFAWPQESPPLAADDCGNPAGYEGLFRVRKVRVTHPLAYLPWVGASVRKVESELAARFAGQPFKLADANQAVSDLRGAVDLPEPSLARVKVNVKMLRLENCADSRLDLHYFYFSTRLAPLAGLTAESNAAAKTQPAETTGYAEGRRFRVAPKLAFNRSDSLGAGGTVSLRTSNSILQAFTLDGLASARVGNLAGSLSGEYAPGDGWVASWSWRTSYRYLSEPAEARRFRQGGLIAQTSATTRPFAGAVLRFGSALEAGNRQSSYSASELAPRTLASSPHGSLKLFAGTSAVRPRSSFSASYGLQLGTVDAKLSPDYRKHIGDVAFDFWIPTRPHREVSFENRLTGGWLTNRRAVPVHERFLGDNSQTLFVPDEAWQIRANPVLRSFPGNRLLRTASGIGANSFQAYNLTVAFTAKAVPLLPEEVSENACVRQALCGQLRSAEAFLDISHRAADRQFGEAARQLDALSRDVKDLNDVFRKERGGPGREMEAGTATACGRNITIALATLRDATGGSASKKYTAIAPILARPEPAANAAPPCGDPDARCQDVVEEEPEEEASGEDVDPSIPAISRCVKTLNARWKSAELTAALERVEAKAKAMAEPFDRIDRAQSAAKAAADMKSVRRIVDSLLREVNVVAVSPVAVFDVARIGPAEPGTNGGVRFAAGGGIRVSLVNTVNFTAGYAANVNRRAGEPYGAVFFSLGFRDLVR